MTISETMAYIQRFQKGGKPVHDLSRIHALLKELGNPQDALRVVHIAGTNGKGSVVAFCAKAAAMAGFRVGTLTSPFIRRYTDRIQLNGREIPESTLCALCEKVKNCTVSADCSQFEITFAIALLWFVAEKCDLVILETGIGGLLDATNVVKHPLVCVITSVSFDHMELLGSTLTQIAAQKAGIIKPGCPVVLSPDNSMDVTCLVQETARRKHATLAIPSMLDCRILSEDLETTVFQYHCTQYVLHMSGRHQVYNALTAIEVIRILGMHGFLITASVTQAAFAQVRVPARTQLLQRNPDVLLDGSHNQAGVMALSDLLHHGAVRPIHGICGMMANKDYKTACGILRNTFDTVTCVDNFSEEAVPSETLAMCFRGYVREVSTCSNIPEALHRATALAQADGGMVVICGSLYLASHVLQQDLVPDKNGH